MKNKILASLFIIPLLFSCNKKTNLGFDNPFPNDPYLDKRIGFQLSAEETPTRQLTPTEISNIILTKSDDKDLPLIDASITSKSGEIHERHYDRAFAGQYKQGYDAFNEMIDTELSSLTYDDINRDDNVSPFRRTLSINKSARTLDYAYGQISKTEEIDNYLYFLSKNQNDESKYDSLDSTDPKEKAKYLSHRIQSKENDKVISVTDSVIKQQQPDPELEFDDNKTATEIKNLSNPIFAIRQNKDFLDDFDPNNQSFSGADKNDNILLWTEKMNPDEEFKLKDGRRYKSSKNELKVSRLSLVKITKNGKTESRYLVNRARRYTETVITSEVIQPNIPPTYLSNPILISFTEEIYHFSIDTKEEIKAKPQYGLLKSSLPTPTVTNQEVQK